VQLNQAGSFWPLLLPFFLPLPWLFSALLVVSIVSAVGLQRGSDGGGRPDPDPQDKFSRAQLRRKLFGILRMRRGKRDLKRLMRRKTEGQKIQWL